MANTQKKSTGLWVWIVIALIVATIAIATLYYIGWFDSNTHVDTPAGDNVEQQYQLKEADADAPGEADWQNVDGQSLQKVITKTRSGDRHAAHRRPITLYEKFLYHLRSNRHYGSMPLARLPWRQCDAVASGTGRA